jgi:hypothetical protein
VGDWADSVNCWNAEIRASSVTNDMLQRLKRPNPPSESRTSRLRWRRPARSGCSLRPTQGPPVDETERGNLIAVRKYVGFVRSGSGPRLWWYRSIASAARTINAIATAGLRNCGAGPKAASQPRRIEPQGLLHHPRTSRLGRSSVPPFCVPLQDAGTALGHRGRRLLGHVSGQRRPRLQAASTRVW